MRTCRGSSPSWQCAPPPPPPAAPGRTAPPSCRAGRPCRRCSRAVQCGAVKGVNEMWFSRMLSLQVFRIFVLIITVFRWRVCSKVHLLNRVLILFNRFISVKVAVALLIKGECFKVVSEYREKYWEFSSTPSCGTQSRLVASCDAVGKIEKIQNLLQTWALKLVLTESCRYFGS